MRIFPPQDLMVLEPVDGSGSGFGAWVPVLQKAGI